MTRLTPPQSRRRQTKNEKTNEGSATASAELSRRVDKVVGYPPLSEMPDLQRREFLEALLESDTFEDLPGRWQAAILEAEQNRPTLRVV